MMEPVLSTNHSLELPDAAAIVFASTVPHLLRIKVNPSNSLVQFTFDQNGRHNFRTMKEGETLIAQTTFLLATNKAAGSSGFTVDIMALP